MSARQGRAQPPPISLPDRRYAPGVPDPEPLWQARFRAPIVGFPTWSATRPIGSIYTSSESGVYQLHAWDRATGERRQITNEPVGLISGEITPDGEWVVWHRDMTGDESGMWVAAPFAGGAGGAARSTACPTGWDEGLAIGRERTVAAISDRDGFAVYGAAAGAAAERIASSPESLELGGSDALMAGPDQGALSADESLLCIEHSEHGDLIHPSLRDPGRAHRRGRRRPARRGPGAVRVRLVADPRRPAARDRPRAARRARAGDLERRDRRGRRPAAAVGSPDRDRGLVARRAARAAVRAAGRPQLPPPVRPRDRRDPALPIHAGSLTGARVRPDGSVWYRLQRGEQPGVVFQVGREEPILVAPRPRPAGRPFVPWIFANEHGDRVQGWLVEPDGPKPWPTLLLIHGGPTSVDLDRWSPEVQAYVDAGFCVAQLNYRGSIGFGAAWRDALIGNIGWPEVEDIVAGHDDLLAKGIADPARSVIAGWSWGGYLTLLMHGMHPGPVHQRRRRRARRRLRVRVPGRVAAPPGVRPGAVRRRPGGRAAALHERSPIDVRGPRHGAAADPRRRARQPLPAAADPQLRRAAQGAQPPARAVPVRDGPLVVRRRRAHPPARRGARLPGADRARHHPAPGCAWRRRRRSRPVRPCRRSPGPRARSTRPRSRVTDPRGPCIIPRMRRLSEAREHLDGSLADPDLLDGNLRDLRRINRRFGGTSLSLRALRALMATQADPERDLRVLDVGAGACDIPLAFAGARGPWRSVDVTAVDSRPEILDAARRIEPALVGRRDVHLDVADGRALPFPDGAFDVAHASLVLHHLDPVEAGRFLRELGRVASVGIVVNDLAPGSRALARRLARAPRADPEPVHAARRAALGSPGVQRRGDARPARRRGPPIDCRDSRIRRPSLGDRGRPRDRGRTRQPMTTVSVDVAIVGGGPAGALTAMLLARAGHGVMVLERAPRWRWRACGVFASPAAVAALRALGLRGSGSRADRASRRRDARGLRAGDELSADLRRIRRAGRLGGRVRSGCPRSLAARSSPASAGAAVRVGATAERFRFEPNRARVDVAADDPLRHRGAGGRGGGRPPIDGRDRGAASRTGRHSGLAQR